MPDREKVIKALEYCVSGDCFSCEYFDRVLSAKCITRLHNDVLILLKEQHDEDCTSREKGEKQ